jgi:hypothetical protein
MAVAMAIVMPVSWAASVVPTIFRKLVWQRLQATIGMLVSLVRLVVMARVIAISVCQILSNALVLTPKFVVKPVLVINGQIKLNVSMVMAAI